MSTISDIAKVSSVVPVPGTALRIVSERRAIVPLNRFHIAAADGEILASADTRADIRDLLNAAKAARAALDAEEQGR